MPAARTSSTRIPATAPALSSAAGHPDSPRPSSRRLPCRCHLWFYTSTPYAIRYSRVSHDSHRGQSHSQSHHVDMCPVCVMCVLRYPIQSYSYTHIQYSRSDVAFNAVAGSRHAPRVRVARSLARPTAGITAQRLRAPKRRPKQLGVRFTNERNCGDCVAFVFLITMPPLGGLHRDSGCH